MCGGGVCGGGVCGGGVCGGGGGRDGGDGGDEGGGLGGNTALDDMATGPRLSLATRSLMFRINSCSS